MPIFSAAIGALIAGAGTFFTAASIGSLVLQTAVGVGLSYAARALAGTPEAQQPASGRGVAGVQGTLQGGGDITRSFPLGASCVGGSLVYANTWGNDGDTPNAFLTQVIALSDVPRPGLLYPSTVYVNGEAVTLLTDQIHPERGIPIAQYRKDGIDHLWLGFHDGTQTTVDTFIANFVANADRPWPSTRVGAGIVYATVTALVEDTLFTGFPQFRFVLPGIPLYDVGKDDTAGGSGSHRWSDPSTWGGDGDDLPAVQIYNVLRGISYGGVWLYGLQGLAQARLPDENWINAINVCRGATEGEGGSPEPSYRAGHELRVSTQIADTIEVLLTACQGRVSETGGVYKLHVGEPDAPVLSFTDDDILSTEEQSFTPFFGLADTVTGMTATYPEPAEGWVTKTAPPLLRSDLEASAADRRLLADVKYDAVPYAAQVQRLMKAALNEAQRARRHTYQLPPAFWLLEPNDVVEWSSARNGYESKLFRVDGIVDKGNLDIVIDLTEVDPSDYDWDHDTDFTPVPRNPIGFVRPGAQAIIDWFAEGAIIADADGLPRRPAILLEWDNTVTADIAAVQFEVRNDFGANDVVHRGRTENVAAGEIMISQSLLPATDYEVRGRYVPANPRETLWSDWLAVTTPDVLFGGADLLASIRYQIKELQEQNAAEIADLKAKLKAAGNQDARNWLDKKQVRNDLSTRVGDAFASIEEVRTVAVDTQQAFASYQITVNAQIGAISSSVDVVAESVASIEGWAASRYAVTLDTNGHAIGFELFNGGPGTGVATFRVDKFELFLNGVGNKAPFVAGTINGVATFGMTGNLLLDGSVKTWNIEANAVKAYHIEADSIATRELAINGVAFENLIAGAATNSFAWNGNDVSVNNFGAWNNLGSGAWFFAGGRIRIDAVCNFVDGYFTTLIQPKLGATIYPQIVGKSVSLATTFSIWVDGALVWQRRYPNMRYINGADNVAPVYWPNSFPATIGCELALTQGVHSIAIQAMREDEGNGNFVASIFYAPQVVVTELRK